MLTRSQGRANLLTGSQGPYELREPLLKIREAVGGQIRESAVLETEDELEAQGQSVWSSWNQGDMVLLLPPDVRPLSNFSFFGGEECKTMHQ